MSIGLLGQKIGMTSVYDANGRLHPVTVIAAGDNVLLARLTNENNGYSAIQVGFATQKESRVSKAELGNFKKANVEPQRFVREFRLKADLPEGDVDLNVTQFEPGDFVDVIGRSKGKTSRCRLPTSSARLASACRHPPAPAPPAWAAA